MLLSSFRAGFFLLWFIDCIESFVLWGGVNISFHSFFFRSGSGESLGKCLLVFHNNYLWSLNGFWFWPLFIFSNFVQEFRMASSWEKNSQPSLPSSLCVVLATFQAWPGMMLLPEMRLCLQLGSSFAFWPADFQDLGEFMNM